MWHIIDKLPKTKHSELIVIEMKCLCCLYFTFKNHCWVTTRLVLHSLCWGGASHAKSHQRFILYHFSFILFPLAPCIITKQQLQVKNLLLSNGQRHSFLIQSGRWQKFMCVTGFKLTASPIRQCFNGHIKLPSCVIGKYEPYLNNFDLSSRPYV